MKYTQRMLWDDWELFLNPKTSPEANRGLRLDDLSDEHGILIKKDRGRKATQNEPAAGTGLDNSPKRKWVPKGKKGNPKKH